MAETYRTTQYGVSVPHVPLCGGTLMLQFPLPPNAPPDPPGAVFTLFSCLVFVFLVFETILLVLPEECRRKVSELQFGPRWAERTQRVRR
jgi:hypothetical protein